MNEQNTAALGLALFEWRLKTLTPLMDEKTQQACAKAIDARLALLSTMVATNPPLVARAGMVSAAAVINALARRALLAEGMSPILDISPLFWYCGYCLTVVELGEAVQDAVKNKSLTLRSTPTRVPLRDTDFRYWLDMELRDKYDGMVLFPDCAEWDAMHTLWPDASLFPPGALLPAEAEAWSVSSGIANPGELMTLLGMEQAQPEGQHQKGSALPEQAKQPDLKSAYANFIEKRKAGDLWTDEMREIVAQEAADKKGERGLRKRIADELKVSVQRVGELIRQHQKVAKNTPLEIVRHSVK